MDNTQADITADLTDERLQQAAARNYRSRSDSDVPRRVARYRAVAAMAREGWQPIRSAERGTQELAEQLRELAEVLTRTGFYRMGSATTTDSWPSRLQRAADLLVHQQEPAPVRASERPWEREGWLDQEGRCWFGLPADGPCAAFWKLSRPSNLVRHFPWSLPHWAISALTFSDAS